MALIRWGNENSMFSQLERMQKEMERLSSSFRPARGHVYPPLNIYNDDECFIVRAEVPGVSADTLDLEVTGETLTLRGERKAPEVGESASYHRRERDYGQFRRSLTLPDRVDGSKVAATYRDGILEIRLPHAEEAKKRKVAVQAS